jgi:hypothetical protein
LALTSTELTKAPAMPKRPFERRIASSCDRQIGCGMGDLRNRFRIGDLHALRSPNARSFLQTRFAKTTNPPLDFLETSLSNLFKYFVLMPFRQDG